MTERDARVRHMLELAEQLQFEVARQGERFSLHRRDGVAEPVERENLTLEEAEEVLNTWKLRGLGGG